MICLYKQKDADSYYVSASPTHAPLLYSYIHNTVKKLENAKSQDYSPKCL